MRALLAVFLLAYATLQPIAATQAAPEILLGDARFPTLHAALDAAGPGETIRVVGGDHAGPFALAKSVTLVGSAGARLLGNGVGSVLTVQADHASVRGFRIEGSGSRHDLGDAGVQVLADHATVAGNLIVRSLFGVWVAEGAYVVVEGNHILGDPAYEEARRGDGIRLWYSPHGIVRNNTLEGTRDLIGWYSRDLVIEGNTIRDARYGLHLMYCSDARILRNDIASSSVGIYAMSSARVKIAQNHIHDSRGSSGYAIAFKDADDVNVHDNLLADNAVGVYLDTTPFTPEGTATFERNVIATNDVGVLLLPSVKGNAFRENTFWDNLEHVAIHGSHANGANVWEGNHWSGFVGYDADGDGYSETPYRAHRLFEHLQDRDARLRALAHTPLADALDAAANAFPLVKPQPKLEDPRPRTSPHPLPVPPARTAVGPPSLAGVAVAGGAFLALVILATGHRRRIFMPHPPIPTPALRIEGLTTGYGSTTILSDIQLELRPGEAVALWGENGAGKTTLLRAILGLIPHEGRVLVQGADTRREPRVARGRLGYVPQDIRLEDAKVREVMRTYAALRGASRRETDALLDRLGLRAHADKRTSELSGGLRQRLGLGLALLSDPPVLLLDEPTANLDAQARAEYLGTLRGLMEEGKAILFTSHRTDEVAALAARVTILRETRQETLPAPRFLADCAGEVAT